MTVFSRIVPRLVRANVEVRIKDVAREDPVGIRARDRDAAAARDRKQTLAVIVGVLKKKRSVHPGGRHIASVEGRGITIKVGGDFGMFPLCEIVCETVDNNRSIANIAGLNTRRRLAANGLRETKRNKPDGGHETHDNAEQADFLAPGALLLRGANTARGEEEARDACGDEIAVDEPGVLRAGTNVVKAPALGLFLGLVHVGRGWALGRRNMLPAQGVARAAKDASLADLLVATEQGLAAPEPSLGDITRSCATHDEHD